MGSNSISMSYKASAGITNSFTQSIMRTAMCGEEFLLGTPVFGSSDKAFLALLGTRNGVSGAYSLLQHKQGFM